VRGDSGHGRVENRREIGVRGKNCLKRRLVRLWVEKRRVNFSHSRSAGCYRPVLYRSSTLLLTNLLGGRLLDMLFTIGTTISGALFIYGAYLAIRYELFSKHTATSATEEELPEIGYYVSW
jgi:hypothetical protein